MHIALFGGTFDPPHLAHQTIAQYLLDENLTDQVWFVPVFQHPWAKSLDKNNFTSYHHRLNMANLLTTDHIKVQEFKDVSFVYPTVTYFQKKFPNDSFSWVMGSEYLPKFHLFLKDHPQLNDVNKFIYPRADAPFEPSFPNMTMLKDAPLVTISSTQIRQLANKYESIQHLVTFPVFSYISTHNLYLRI